MNTTTRFELVDIVTSDHYIHQGMIAEPQKKGDTAILWIHGLTGNFYSNTKGMNEIACRATESGMAFASCNTRGHDFVSSVRIIDTATEKGYAYGTIGAGVEEFTKCVEDIDAAVSFLAGRGYTKIILVGHSTGANKACYYAGTVDDARVAGVVLSGPMSDRYSYDADAATYAKHKREMETLIAEGKGDELLSGYDFFPLTPNRWMSLLSQGSVEDVFNYRDETGALETFSRIRVPLLVVFGENDEHADRPVKEIRAAFDAHANSSVYTSVLVPGADHSFSGKEIALVSSIVSWAKHNI